MYVDIAVDIHSVEMHGRRGDQPVSYRVPGRIVGALRLENSQQGNLGDQAAVAEPDNRELAPGDQLVGEGA